MSLHCHVIYSLSLVLLTVTLVSDAHRPLVPRTEKKYFIHVQSLTEGLDDINEQPTLVSITESTSLWLPRGSAEDNDEHLSFNEDLDPFWVHVLRRRRFDVVEWSGCGGMWRPEWSATLYDKKSNISKSTEELIYELSHHTVCYFSSLSACGWDQTKSTDGKQNNDHDENDDESDNMDNNTSAHITSKTQRHHQWLTQFVSSLLSSPLSWSPETPRHIRPLGALRLVPNSAVTADVNGKDHHWCSYHLALHDTVCTQHVSALLNGGRSGRGVDERIPKGIFRAGLVTMQKFFSSEFHHFHFSVSQSPIPQNNNTKDETEINLLIRMAFVVRKGDFNDLAHHWSSSLHEYVDRLTFFVGSNVNEKLKRSINGVEGLYIASMKKDEESSLSTSLTSTVELAPTVHYYISTVGHDRGTYQLVLLPSEVSTMKSSDVENSEDLWYGLKAGDTIESLLLFPLHVLRPSLHEMRSDPHEMSKLENAFFDDSANVLTVLVKTVLTEDILHEIRENRSGTASRGLILCEFPFHFGWSALKDMPHDANSNRILPQPVIRVGQRFARDINIKTMTATSSIPAEEDGSCAASTCAPVAAMRIDHQSSLERILRSMLPTEPQDVRNGSCVCYYWIRCSNVAGTTMPVPDPAMVFNVVSLGLVFFGILSGGVVRVTRRFFEKSVAVKN
ncbi:glycosylphosphatidylinositol (GPI) anchor [Trypanosoma theileri]|uniref:Glycosylphosphatidylinositol (GPI) anchor n=1 Tax=Trypanosoma theileri TaxID=67003 RepID=A0A1X0P9R2_9TRYP|nr:glycosylphosphatidylinositol (GPI) anchor [Trypanosoma theileri]ORC93672.1 glycosylphosphatidylinositol (GPI) anchor [Trypanosoma theileri]